MTENRKNSECSTGCMCPWKMCMCKASSVWMAFVMTFVLNFIFLYIVHAVVMYFAAGHMHFNIIFFAVAAFLAAWIMAYHRHRMRCSGVCKTEDKPRVD